MKIFKSILSLFATVSIVAVSCTPVTPPADSITVSLKELNFEAADNQPVSIDVKSNVKWVAKGYASWIHVAPASGNGDCTVIVTVDNNVIEEVTTADRNSSITFTAGTAGDEITVSQKGAEYNPPVPPAPPATEEEKTFSFASALGESSVAVACHVDGQLRVVTVEGVSGKKSFTATVPIADNYLIVAPATALENGTMTIPSEQDGTAPQIKAVTVSKDNLSSITLAPLTATVSFSFPGETLAKAVVIPQALEETITGSYSVVDMNGAPTIVANGGGSRAITVSNPTGTVKVSVMPAVYSSGIAVRPYTLAGITTGAFADGEQALTAGTQATAVVTKEISVASDVDLYTVIAYSADADTSVTTNNAFRLCGTTVKLSAGEYNPSRTLKIKYIFGDFNYKVNFTLQGVEGTVITGDGKRRIVELDENTEITINNITFKDAAASSGNGGAILCYGTNSTISNCTFINNMLTGKNDKGELQSSGACIAASDAGNGDPSNVTVINCTFEGAGQELCARNAGAVYTDKNSTMTCTKCTFKNIVSYNAGGAANVTGGTQEYVDCTFDNCSNKVGTGGAIHCNASNAVLKLTNCTIKNCEGRANDHYETVGGKGTGGAVSLQEGYVDIEGCTFEGNMGSSGSVIYTASGSGLLRVNNSVFKNNKGSDRGLIQLNGKSAAFFNNCSFYDNTMRTNQWGRILHGGNPSIACFNNCTIYNNTSAEDGGSSVCLNNDGSIVVVNSTVLNSNARCLVRNSKSDNGATVLIANSILLNTYANGKLFAYNPSGDNDMKSTCKTYNCYLGQTSDTPTSWVSSNDKTGVTSLEGGSFNAVKGVYLWDGPEAGFTKTTGADVKALLNAMTSDNGNTRVGGAFGPAFAKWVEEKGGFIKDALGATRTTTGTWPGAIEGSGN